MRTPTEAQAPKTQSSYRPWDDVSDAIRRSMKSNKSMGTKPEIYLRKALHQLGYRFRTHVRDLPGNPDLVFTRRRIVIQVRGCFWHQHRGCRLASVPKSRNEYWDRKFRRTVERDTQNAASIEDLGWRQLVVWECSLRDHERRTLSVIIDFLGPPRIL